MKNHFFSSGNICSIARNPRVSHPWTTKLTPFLSLVPNPSPYPRVNPFLYASVVVGFPRFSINSFLINSCVPIFPSQRRRNCIKSAISYVLVCICQAGRIYIGRAADGLFPSLCPRAILVSAFAHVCVVKKMVVFFIPRGAKRFSCTYCS